MLLFQLSRPRHLRPEMEIYFGFKRSKSWGNGECIVIGCKALHGKPPNLSPQNGELCWANLKQTWWACPHRLGFTHGTLKKNCCPSYFQKLLYIGHDQAHGIKFQYVVSIPDGLFACFYRPITGNPHD
jgi:hypothetical protein